ncbi:MAG TPA: ribokinase [Bacteroidales bacterium]|jgi:ribokinase|nr:MAG: Ribokinase [Bacteroidetes bacterium ADurb.Bin145]HOU02776.1 ribokinase [Bacteroidales bacterium]HQG63109.1 ribokinase [Bacteroidales bacterium]HQK67971.1 ribokinase [Bacteroidales bacterium]
MSKILVIGSSNTDMVIKTGKLPEAGETILGGTFLMNPGGKGANQAVAAARLGGKVTFITKSGKDLFGNQIIASLKKEGINTKYIIQDEELPSGIALITVDSRGENSIVVAPGSNSNLFAGDIPSDLLSPGKFAILLLQLEIPMMTVEYAALTAAENGIKVIFNPAPAQHLRDYLLRHIYLITPDVTETEIITGIKVRNESTAETAAKYFMSKGVKNVIITMGAAGAYLRSTSFSGMVPGVRVEAVDTTAAGDVFNGALAVAIAEGKDLRDAVIFANKAAAISVTRLGAQASAPYRNEIK